MDKNKLLKPLLLIVVIIIFCSVLVRVFSGSETLTEYAGKNPEIAYQTKEKAVASGQKEPAAANGHNIEDDSATQSAGNALQITDNNIPAPSVGSASSLTENNESEGSSMTAASDRTIYQNGFYYEPLSDDMIKRITGISYPVTKENMDNTVIEAINIAESQDEIQIAYDDLRYVSVLYYNFKGIERTGELICNKAIAQDLLEIFYELYQNEYQIEQIRLIDEYSGDDTLSMQDNNTSCFNYRVVDGTDHLSKHALGLAVDINPFFNPYVVYKNDGTAYISPQGSETYADRSKEFAYKIDENDLCYKLFKAHGFTWGGDWNSCKDYQHFQKTVD